MSDLQVGDFVIIEWPTHYDAIRIPGVDVGEVVATEASWPRLRVLGHPQTYWVPLGFLRKLGALETLAMEAK